jgi:hypothetical protein
MPAQIFGTPAVVTILNRAFNDASPSYATFNNQVAAAGTTREANLAFAKTFGAGFAGLTADAAATKLLTNLGLLPNADLQTGLKDYITSVGVSEIGVVALQLGEILSGLENATGIQAIYAAPALAWNNEVTASYNYSANPSSSGPSTPGNAQPGTTFTLTTGADSLEPNSAVAANKTTAGDDTFRALNSDSTNANNTLGTNDVLDGGSGNDTLNVELAAATAATDVTVKPVLKNIENLNIAAVAVAGANKLTLNLADSTGVTSITSKASSGSQKSFIVSGVALGTGITLAGDHAGATVTTTFAGATGTADAASITLNKATGNGALVVDGIETLNIASTGSANTLTLNDSTLETVNVTGSVSTTVTVGAGALGLNTLKTVDASALTGNFTLGTITTANNDVTIKGSAGNNVLDIAGTKKATITTLGGNDSIILGGTDVKTVDSGAGNDQIFVTVAAKNVITTGAGNDTIAFSGAAANATSTAAATTTIKDFVSGSDKLDLKGVVGDGAGALALVTQAKLTAIQTAVDSLAADKTLADALSAAANLIGTNDVGVTNDAELAYFTFKGDTYLYADQSDNGGGTYVAGDLVIKLTGAVSVASGDLILA